MADHKSIAADIVSEAKQLAKAAPGLKHVALKIEQLAKDLVAAVEGAKDDAEGVVEAVEAAKGEQPTTSAPAATDAAKTPATPAASPSTGTSTSSSATAPK